MVPRDWLPNVNPLAALEHSVPHRVVPQLLRPLLAAPLPPTSIKVITLHDAAVCITTFQQEANEPLAFRRALAQLPALTKLDTLWAHCGVQKLVPVDFDPLMSPALRGITSLHLSSSIHIDGSVLSRIKRLLNLTTLQLRYCHGLSSTALEQLAPLQKLRTLNLAGSKEAPKALGLKHVSILKNLTELDIGSTERAVDAAGLRHLTKLPQLESLCLDRCVDVDTAACAEIAKMPALQRLSVASCKGLGTAGLKLLAEKKGGHLPPTAGVSRASPAPNPSGAPNRQRQAPTSSARSTTAARGSVAKRSNSTAPRDAMPNARTPAAKKKPSGESVVEAAASDRRPLTSLAFAAHVEFYTDAPDENRGGAELAEISTMSHLTTLWLRVQNVEEKEYAVLGQLSHLTDLTLDRCQGFTDQSFQAITTSCRGLTSLTIRHCTPFTGEDVSDLKDVMPRLRTLRLEDNGYEEEEE